MSEKNMKQQKEVEEVIIVAAGMSSWVNLSH